MNPRKEMLAKKIQYWLLNLKHLKDYEVNETKNKIKVSCTVHGF